MIVTSLQTWPAQASAYHPVFRRALAFIAQHDFRHEKPGKIDIIPGKLFCLLQEMDSVPFSDARPESHRQFIDIQYLISGHEVMGVSSVSAVNIASWKTVRLNRTFCSGRLMRMKTR
jgi:YhcH/YjgK/YiaL family protein